MGICPTGIYVSWLRCVALKTVHLNRRVRVTSLAELSLRIDGHRFTGVIRSRVTLHTAVQ